MKNSNATLDTLFEIFEQLGGVSLAKKIVQARQHAGLTQAQLAKRIGKSRSSIFEYENADHEPPLTVLRRIAKVTGVDLSELVA